MNELTCKDCKYFIGNSINEKSSKCVLTGQHYAHDICNRFETSDGKRPRFCRLASSVDEMVQCLVETGYTDEGNEGWYFVKEPSNLYFDKDLADQQAKKWLMEVEEDWLTAEYKGKENK